MNIAALGSCIAAGRWIYSQTEPPAELICSGQQKGLPKFWLFAFHGQK
jgi:hypothetical protein